MIGKTLYIIGIPMIFILANYLIILLHEKKYKENFPYTPYKSKKNSLQRIVLGLLAGFHYLTFIGTYNHKKYNTQVDTPKTLECYFGNISQGITLFAYVYVAYMLYSVIGFFYFIFLSLPIVTNIISLIIKT